MKKDNLKALIQRYQDAKDNNRLRDSSEATIRAWIDELLYIFEWDVQNTQQVLTEHSLGKKEKEKLRSIGSTNTRPDYTLVNGKVKIAFIDAKSLAINIKEDKEAAFQIRSYGWSIGASFSIITNFEQMAIYDCSVMPLITDEANCARRYFLTYKEYACQFDLINSFLLKENLIHNRIQFLTNKGESLDERFSKMLGEIRKELARSILIRNSIDNVNTLSFYVQTIINRILFIRVCEARGLEEEGLLYEYAKDDFWENFKRSCYCEFYSHYDGPMFKRIAQIQDLKIDNETFVKFINTLYYPSPYRFDVIPLKTLSDMYDLFLGYQLVEKDGEITDELKSELKKSNGAVTTPKHLVDRVIKSTIPDTYAENLSITNILDLRIIDIACGSGVFLVGVYDYLKSLIEKKAKKGETLNEDYYIITDDSVTLTIAGRKAILNNCIYGVDINPEAVEVAKLSLSLKLIDDYDQKNYDTVGLLGSQILNGLGTNIKCGNSLVSSDIEDICPGISTNIEELQLTNAFDWNTAYPKVFKRGGFDIVIGNPPYVEVKNYNVGLPNMAFYIKKTYKSARNGKIDLAIPFIERGLELLNKNGILGYIVQKRFFKDQYGKGIRKLLTQENNYVLNGIYDFEETDLFKGRTTYVAIIVCNKKTENNKYIWYMHSQNHTYNKLLPGKMLSDTPWSFENPQLSSLRLRLSQELGTIQDVCHVKVGLQVLWNDAYQIKAYQVKDGLIHGYSKIDEDVIIEYNACKPLICNEQFAPLTRRRYSTYAIFPYSVTDTGIVTGLSIQEYSTLYPKAGSYLRKHQARICNNVETLPQKNNDYDIEEYWHLYTRANNLGSVGQKICIPMTAQYPQASVVLEKHVYCDNANMFFIQFKEDSDETLLYALSAIINSTLFSTLAQTIANPQRGGYFKFNKQFLDPIPVPKEALLTKNAKIVKLANLARKIETTNEAIRNSVGKRQSGLVTSLNKLWQELDRQCLKLYGITKKSEISLLHQHCRKDRTSYEQAD